MHDAMTRELPVDAVKSCFRRRRRLQLPQTHAVRSTSAVTNAPQSPHYVVHSIMGRVRPKMEFDRADRISSAIRPCCAGKRMGN